MTGTSRVLFTEPNFRLFVLSDTSTVNDLRSTLFGRVIKKFSDGCSHVVVFWGVQLLGKIKAAIAREWQNKDKDVDWELLERMEVHQAAVDAAVSSAAKNTSGGQFWQRQCTHNSL